MDIVIRIGNYEGGYRGTVWVNSVQALVSTALRRTLNEAGKDANELYWLIDGVVL